MLIRTVEERVTFNNPFKVPGQRELIPSGVYRINIMQELLEGLSFIAYRKTSVVLYIPINSINTTSKESSIIYEPKDFEALILNDKISKSDLIKSLIAEDIMLEQP